MALTVADLLAKLRLDMSGFTEGIKSVEAGTAKIKSSLGDAESATKKAGEAAAASGKGFKDLGTSLDDTTGKLQQLLTPANLFGTVVGVTMVAAMRNAVSATLEYANELTRLQNITGASVSSLAVLKQAADNLGVSSGGLQRALFLMSNEIQTAGTGLGRLGISIRDSRGHLKNEVDILFEVSDKLKGMSDATAAANIARDIFGRGAAELLPVLLAGSQRLKEMGADAKKFGLDIGEAGRKELKDFDIALNQVGDAMLGVRVTLIRDLRPALESAAEGFTGLLAKFQRMPIEIRRTEEALLGIWAAATVVVPVVKALGFALGLLGVSSLAAGAAALAAALGPVAIAVAAVAVVLGGLIALDIGGIQAKIKGLFESFGFMTQESKTNIEAMTEAYKTLEAELIKPTKKPTEADTVGELQKRLAFMQQLTQAQIALAQATLAPIDAQLVAVQKQLDSQREQIRVANELDKTTVGRARNAQILATQEATAVALTNRLLAQAAQETLKRDAEVREARIQGIAEARDREVALYLSRLELEAENFLALQTNNAVTEKARQDHLALIERMEIEHTNRLNAIDAQRAVSMLTANAAMERSAIDANQVELVAAVNRWQVDVNEAAKAFSAKVQFNQATVQDVLDMNVKIAAADSALAQKRRDYAQSLLEARIGINKLLIDQTVAQQQAEVNLAEQRIDALRDVWQHEFDTYKITQADLTAELLRQEGVRRDASLLFFDQSARAAKSRATEDISAVQSRIDTTVGYEEKGAQEILAIQTRLKGELEGLEAAKRDTKQKYATNILHISFAATKEEEEFLIHTESEDLKRRIANLESWRQTHAENVKAVLFADAELYRTKKQLYDRDVENAIDAELKKTALYKDEAAKQLAIQAGILAQLKQARDQVIEFAALVFTQAARDADSLSAAFQTGFSEAASKASDAFDVMRTAGQQMFDALKSGASDFFYDAITGAKSLGDTFADLGKRILRIFTDAFASILVRWAVTAAGFSLPGALGIGTAAAGGLGPAGLLGAPSGTLGIGGGGIGDIGGLLGGGGIGGLLDSVGGLGGILKSIAGTISMLFEKATHVIFTTLLDMSSALFGDAATMASFSILSMIAEYAIPVVGTAIAVILDLIKGNIRGAGLIAGGAIIGSFFGPIGTAIGAFIGGIVDFLIGLFSGPPTATLYVKWQSTFVEQMDAFLKGTVESFTVAVSADMPKSQQRALETQISAMVNGLLRSLVGAFTQASAQLPASITALMKAGLERLAGTWVVAGRKEGFHDFPLDRGANELKDFLKQGLPDMIIRQFFGAMTGGVGPGQLDLNDFKRAGETLADALSRVLNSMVGLAGVMKAFGMDADAFVASLGTGNEALRAYLRASVDFFGSFRVGTETFKETADRLSQAVGGMQAIFQATGQALPKLASIEAIHKFVESSIAFFTRFAQEGEEFKATVERVTKGIVDLIGLTQQLSAGIVGLSNDVEQVVALVHEQVAIADRQIAVTRSRLESMIAQGASPDAILAMAQGLTQMIAQRYAAEINLAKSLSAEVDKLNQSISATILSMAQLSGVLITIGRGGIAQFQILLDDMVRLFQQAPTVEGRIQIIQSGIAAFAQAINALIDSGQKFPALVAFFNNFNGLLVQAFDIVLGQIMELQDPQRAVAALQGLANAVITHMNDAIAATQRYFALERQRIQDGSAARIDALTAEKDAITELAATQKATLQAQLEDARAWGRTLDAVRKQLTDMQLTLATPENALERLATAQSLVAQAKATFAATGTPEAATALQQALADELKVGQETFQRPSAAYQAIFDQVSGDLQTIADIATPKATEADLLQQIADLDTQTLDALAVIDQQIADERTALTDVLSWLSAQEQETINWLRQETADRLERIQVVMADRLTALMAQEAEAQARLEALIGDHTLDQFIADKNAEQAALLGDIRDLLQTYLGQLGIEVYVSPDRLTQAVGSLTTLAQLAQGLLQTGGLNNPAIAQQLMLASQQAAWRQPEGVTAALRNVLSLGADQFTSPIGLQVMDSLRSIVAEISASQFQAAINALSGLVGLVQAAGITTQVPVPGFQQGTEYVPRTGLALVHQGERIMPAGQHSGGDTFQIGITYAGAARKDEWDAFMEYVVRDARIGKLAKIIAQAKRG